MSFLQEFRHLDISASDVTDMRLRPWPLIPVSAARSESAPRADGAPDCPELLFGAWDRVFSAGVDVPRLVRRFFLGLPTGRMPTVAAILDLHGLPVNVRWWTSFFQ